MIDKLHNIRNIGKTDPQGAIDKIANLDGVDFGTIELATGILPRTYLAIITARMLKMGLHKQRFDYVSELAKTLDRLQNRHCHDKYVRQHDNGAITTITADDVDDVINILLN